MFAMGDRVRINLQDITDNIEMSIQGLEGIIVEFPNGYSNGFDYAVRINNMVFGLNEEDLEHVKE